MKNAVITGLGLLTPVGVGVEASWSAIKDARSGIGPITRFDASDYPTKIAGEVKDFDHSGCIDSKEAKKMDRFIHFAIVAATEALRDARLNLDDLNDAERARVGVIIGAGIGGLPIIERTAQALALKGPRRGVSPFFIPSVLANLASGQVSIHFRARGAHGCPVTACASGASAIGDAARIIERGDADAIIAGGAESTITGLGIAGFAAARALSKRNDEPERASRPFDKDRDGFVMGEGAGIVIVENEDLARARGARIYARVSGYGMSGDAHHLTAPHPEGLGARACMRAALDDARIAPERIDYINAHATSTMADTIETLAIKNVFGQRARTMKISSTKSMIGHLLGAAGAVEAIFSILAIRDNVAPPTINLDEPDPDCDLDYTPNKSVAIPIEAALSNSFGFGGVNVSLVFERAETNPSASTPRPTRAR